MDKNIDSNIFVLRHEKPFALKSDEIRVIALALVEYIETLPSPESGKKREVHLVSASKEKCIYDIQDKPEKVEGVGNVSKEIKERKRVAINRPARSYKGLHKLDRLLSEYNG
jgi:hypothetical protein